MYFAPVTDIAPAEILAAGVFCMIALDLYNESQKLSGKKATDFEIFGFMLFSGMCALVGVDDLMKGMNPFHFTFQGLLGLFMLATYVNVLARLLNYASKNPGQVADVFGKTSTLGNKGNVLDALDQVAFSIGLFPTSGRYWILVNHPDFSGGMSCGGCRMAYLFFL